MIEQIKKLRELTFAPLKDCKEALEMTGGDLEWAQQYLRDQGVLKAAKKADRETFEGTVVVKSFGDKTVWLKLLCETDFVAKNENFLALALLIATELSQSSDRQGYDNIDIGIQEKIQNHITDNALKIGENMQIAQVIVTSAPAYAYTHPGDKVAAIVFYDGDVAVAKAVALQVAAMNPQYFVATDVPADLAATLTAEATAEMEGSDKPADIIEKIVAGKVSKQLSEYVLMEQESIVDSSKKVKEMLWSTVINGYVRLSVK
jgi:elongation factor Ts